MGNTQPDNTSSLHIHILGICGTFMGSLAVLAQEKGIKVTGCDQSVYPPMSTQLESQGIELISGYGIEQLDLNADLYVIGNAISRGNLLLEEILNKGLPYVSGPGFLANEILPGKWVLGVSGTHGKTTTSSMLAWILEYAGMKPGFLIGGVPENFSCSARIGETPFFVIEADEYDSAFFDKRSKFVHYRPRTLVINNLEFDHADIFDDLPAIQKQFHHVVRTVPSNGRVIFPENTRSIDQVIDMGCWSEVQTFAASCSDDTPYWSAIDGATSSFQLCLNDESVVVEWALTGDHNIQNGVAAMLAARHVGVSLKHSAMALSLFEGVKRRMQLISNQDDVRVYDDFAHHPTAIKSTLAGLRRSVGSEKIIALIEPRSNTMKMGIHHETLIQSADDADEIIWANLTEIDWLEKQVQLHGDKHSQGTSIDELLHITLDKIVEGAHVVVMSNGGFSGIHQRLVSAIEDDLGMRA